jgi:hypothetical protein
MRDNLELLDCNVVQNGDWLLCALPHSKIRLAGCVIKRRTELLLSIHIITISNQTRYKASSDAHMQVPIWHLPWANRTHQTDHSSFLYHTDALPKGRCPTEFLGDEISRAGHCGNIERLSAGEGGVTLELPIQGPAKPYLGGLRAPATAPFHVHRATKSRRGGGHPANPNMSIPENAPHGSLQLMRVTGNRPQVAASFTQGSIDRTSNSPLFAPSSSTQCRSSQRWLQTTDWSVHRAAAQTAEKPD